MSFKRKTNTALSSLLNIPTSFRIIVLLSIALLGVISGGYFVLSKLNTLQNDALAINSLGVVRGSIQLITKRELNNIDSNSQISKVDAIFVEIENTYLTQPSNLEYVEDYEIDQLISTLDKNWLELKGLYLQHDDKNNLTDAILNKSEQCWELANDLVYKVQAISEYKLNDYRNLILLIFSAVSILVIIIIRIVYRIIHKVLEHEAISDGLTGLYNRSYFNKVLTNQTALFRRYNTHFSLTLLDIDFFKRINDDFGHPEGDRVLIAIAELLKEHTREADFLFRVGGEEFAVISPSTDITNAMKLAEKYRQLVAQENFGIGHSISISLGVSQSFSDCDEQDLYKNADIALYQAKSSGRNKAVAFNN